MLCCLNNENCCSNNLAKQPLNILEIILSRLVRSQHFYNIFTTNHRWLVVISWNLNLTLRLLFCPTISYKHIIFLSYITRRHFYIVKLQIICIYIWTTNINDPLDSFLPNLICKYHACLLKNAKHCSLGIGRVMDP